MPRTKTSSSVRRPKRRADAERNLERILDAALHELAADADVSMSEIARRAGLVRATLYVHFPTREALLEAVTHRAFAEISGVIEAAEPERGDPADALARVVAQTWRTLDRYHALIAFNTQAHDHEELHSRHGDVLGMLRPLVERGQKEGAFRVDVPADWHLTMFMAVIHAASGELRAGRLEAGAAEQALVDTVLGAVSTPGQASGSSRPR